MRYVAIVPLLLVVACGSIHERNAVPEPLAREAQVPGIPGARLLFEAGRTDFATVTRFLEQGPRLDVAGRHLTLLAVSGGGDNGAFGAGILCGWTEAKDRPEFDVVTGISTGGLTAPYAFLGPKWDARLRDAFTDDHGGGRLRVARHFHDPRPEGRGRRLGTARAVDREDLHRGGPHGGGARVRPGAQALHRHDLHGR